MEMVIEEPKEESSVKVSKNKYFFVLVHGLDGDESDFTPMKNSIKKVFGGSANGIHVFILNVYLYIHKYI